MNDKQKIKLLCASAAVSLLLVFIAVGVSQHPTLQAINTPQASNTPTAYPTLTLTPTPYTIYTPLATPTPVPSPTATPQPEPEWLTLSVAPTSPAYGDPIYITVESPISDIWVTVSYQGVSELNTWVAESVQVYIEASTLSGTHQLNSTLEGYSFPEGQYNFLATAGTTTDTASIYVYL
jgi:hypothetical protein